MCCFYNTFLMKERDRDGGRGVGREEGREGGEKEKREVCFKLWKKRT